MRCTRMLGGVGGVYWDVSDVPSPLHEFGVVDVKGQPQAGGSFGGAGRWGVQNSASQGYRVGARSLSLAFTLA